MKIKTSLFFRSFKKKTILDKNYIEVRFLDDDDNSFNFIFPDDEKSKKYLTMTKDTRVDLDLRLYEPNDKKYCKYALWVV